MTTDTVRADTVRADTVRADTVRAGATAPPGAFRMTRGGAVFRAALRFFIVFGGAVALDAAVPPHVVHWWEVLKDAVAASAALEAFFNKAWAMADGAASEDGASSPPAAGGPAPSAAAPLPAPAPAPLPQPAPAPLPQPAPAPLRAPAAASPQSSDEPTRAALMYPAGAGTADPPAAEGEEATDAA